MERYDNKVILQGKIIAIKAKKDEKEPKVASVVIETTASRDGEKRNRVLAMCFDERAGKAVGYKAGDFVRIIGNMQTRRRKNASGKSVTDQNVVVEEIGAAESRIEEAYGIEGNGLYEKVNEVHIMGIVTGISDYGKDMKCIAVRTVRGGNVSVLILKAYVHPSNKELLEGIRQGDNICAIATIQVNARRGRERPVIYFESLIIREISVLDRQGRA